MRKVFDLTKWKKRLLSVPLSFVAYMKNSTAAIDDAKKERRFFAPLIYTILLFFSCAFLIGGHLKGLDKSLSGAGGFVKELGLFDYVRTFSVGVSFALGFLLFFILSFVYIFTRLICVKIYTRGTKASAVLSDSFIEFGMNSIPLSLLFFIFGLLSSCVWWMFFLLALFIFMFYMMLLIVGIFDAVERKKRTFIMSFVVTLFVVFALALFLAVVLATAGYAVISIVNSISENIDSIMKNVWELLKKFGEKLINYFVELIVSLFS